MVEPGLEKTGGIGFAGARRLSLTLAGWASRSAHFLKKLYPPSKIFLTKPPFREAKIFRDFETHFSLKIDDK